MEGARLTREAALADCAASIRPVLPPLVSIGIPTFNRGALLDRAVQSALAQTVTDLEVVISDNASSDDTAERCARWQERDPRVRIVRHATNIGPTANFNSLFSGFRGTYAMLLSDDDHLDPDYVATCVGQLDADPGLVCVAGTARYVRDGQFIRSGALVAADADRPAQRLRQYFGQPSDGPFYGVTRRAVLEAAAPMPNTLGNDWLQVGRIAVQGRIAMTDATHVHRELDGTSASVGTILATFGRSKAAARVPHLVMAWAVFSDIGWRGAPYAGLGGRGPRLISACRAAPGVIDWPSLAWHLTAPTIERLRRWPATRWIARAYDRLARALGAGQQA